MTGYRDGIISDALIWKIRDELDPPCPGYVMFSSSAAEYNIEHLVDYCGLDPMDIEEMEYGTQDTVWIPLEEMKHVDPKEYERIMSLRRDA